MVEFGMAEEGSSGCGGGKGKMAIASCSSAATNQSPLAVPPLNAVSQYVPYPLASASLEEVKLSPKLFMDTLQKLHAYMGTKFMIPIVGGKELDMHRLFVEVTHRGGIEKVIRDRRWKEVLSLFGFPATATNASHMVRKHYGQYLYHYEQIYYFNAKAWTPSSDHFQSLPALQLPSQNSAERLQTSQGPHRAPEMPQSINCEGFSTGVPPIDTQVTGVIEGKFEFGYLVSVKVGSKRLKGVLYHTPQSTEQNMVTHSKTVSGVSVGNNPGPSGVHRRRRRKKSEMKKRDPAHPKPNRSSYNFFFAEQYARLKPQYLGKDREISKMIGELWSNMTESDKEMYKQQAVADKDRYKLEMEVYKEKLQTRPMTSDIVPVQQLPLDVDVNTAETSEIMETQEGEESPENPENETSTDKSGEMNTDMDLDGSGLEKRVDKQIGSESLECSGNVVVVVETENRSAPDEARETMDFQHSVPTQRNECDS